MVESLLCALSMILQGKELMVKEYPPKLNFDKTSQKYLTLTANEICIMSTKSFFKKIFLIRRQLRDKFEKQLYYVMRNIRPEKFNLREKKDCYLIFSSFVRFV